MKAIYLTGFMGTGKSTIGKILSSKLDVDVIDTDNYIMGKVGKNISIIFEDEGEEAFRNYESEALKELPTNNVIISTGGGMILREENRQFMKENGYIINLDCDFQVVLKRIQKSKFSKDTRPLFQNDIESLEQRYLARKPIYLDADYVVQTNNSLNKSINKIIEWISKKGE